MRAWLVAAVLCARASAAVVEAPVAGPAAPVSGALGAAGAVLTNPIQPVPGVTVLAPSLNSAVITAFPGVKASPLPAGAVRLAPPGLPAAAAAQAQPSAAPAAAPEATASSRKSKDLIPPPAVEAVSGAPAAAPSRSFADDDAASLAGRVRDARAESAAAAADAGPRVTGEAASISGRRLFDRATEHAFLDERPFAAGHSPEPPVVVAAAVAPASARRFASVRPGLAPSAAAPEFAEGEALRDAVASPVPPLARGGAEVLPGAGLFNGALPRRGAAASPSAAAAASGAATVPVFERLSLETGAGLAVKVRAALGFESAAAPSALRAAAAPAANPAPSAGPAAMPDATPVTSTEWLERRGLLETLSASEAAAVQSGVAMPVAVMTRAAAVLPTAPAPRREPRMPPLAWWGLALLPAALALLAEGVRL